MNSTLRLLFLLFIAITAIKTNAQTYKYQNGNFIPTTSEERYKPPPVKYEKSTTTFPKAEKSNGTYNQGNSDLIKQEEQKELRLKQEKLKNDSIAKVNEKVANAKYLEKRRIANDKAMDELRVITGVRYDYAIKYDGYIIVEKERKKGIIYSDGKIMVPLLYDNVYEFNEDLATVYLNSKYGAIDKNGTVVIPLIYDELNIKNGFAKVILNGKCGLVSKTGKLLIPAKYEDLDYLGTFADFSTYAAKLNNKWGLINTNGALLIPFIYEEIKDNWRQSGFNIVVLGTKLGLISLEGELILPAEYEVLKKLDEPVENIYLLRLNNKWGYINPKEKTFISCAFDEIREFNNGLAEVKMERKWGYIDSNLKTIIPCIYNTVNHFSEGLAEVSYDEKWGYIDVKGNVVIPFKYQYAESFYKGRARVCKSKNLKKKTYIDASGKELKD